MKDNLLFRKAGTRQVPLTYRTPSAGQKNEANPTRLSLFYFLTKQVGEQITYLKS